VNGRVPLLLHVFSSFAVGGQQIRFAALAGAFGARYRHIVLAMDGEFACATRLAPELDLRCLPVEVTKHATLANVRCFRHRLCAIAPDLLVTYNWGAIEWAMANIPRRIRHIHVEDGFGPEERSHQLRRRVWIRRIVLARSLVAVPSRTLWRIATEVWRLHPSRVRYVPNGVDVGRFAGPHHSGPEPVIGTVTALRPEKNVARLLRAFRLVVNETPARLVIAGDGPERRALERLAGELGLADRVRFTGNVDEPWKLYRMFDVFALSSDTEQMPLSLIEAMASGVPAAATDVGDVGATLAAENQDFITPLNDAALARAMVTLLRNANLRDVVGGANRLKAVHEFDQSSMVSAWGALFDGASVA
jgi:glycosyltransferase involved in cell wall biosynthesis